MDASLVLTEYTPWQRWMFQLLLPSRAVALVNCTTAHGGTLKFSEHEELGERLIHMHWQ